jgi:Ca2+-binding EF-hand superfamily protein
MRSLILLLFAVFAVPVFAQAPGSPSNVVATATAGTSVTVTWDASQTADGYLVFRDSVQVGSFTTNRTLTDTGLSPGTLYSYTVVAVNTFGNSPQSAPATVTTPNTPGTPAGLAGSATSAGVVLSWNSVSGATGYVVFRDGTELDTTTNPGYTDTDVEPSTSYRYSVSATNAGGESPESAQITVTTRGDGSQREAVWTREFNRADANFDGIVTFEEYLVAFPNNLPWVVMFHRFNSSDDDVSGDLTVDEYITHFAGRKIKRPSKAQTFFLIDLDGDDLLDPDEFALSLNRGTKFAQVMKRFNKLDKDGSTLMSQREFGIRYGTVEETED